MNLGSAEDLTDQTFMKVNQILDMMLVWVQFNTSNVFILLKEQNMVKILTRIPFVRQGFFIRCLQWLVEGMLKLKMHATEEPNIADKEEVIFQLGRGSGLPGLIPIHTYIIQCLRSFKQLSHDPNSKHSLAGIDLVKLPSEDTSLSSLLKKIDPSEESILTTQSILTQIVQNIVDYFSIMNAHPGLIIGSVSSKEDQENSDRYWEEIVSLLSSIFKHAQTSIKA